MNDPKRIHRPLIKPNPAIFVQNSLVRAELTSEMQEIWIENSSIGKGWGMEQRHLLTGTPENNWQLKLRRGDCLDVVPSGPGWVLRPYGYEDSFQIPSGCFYPMPTAISSTRLIFLMQQNCLPKRNGNFL